MGFNSLIFICNDALGDIDRDPVAWWEKAKSMLMTPPQYRPRYGGDVDGTFGFGSSANGFKAVHNEHADTTAIYAVGGNSTSLLGMVPNSGRHHGEADQVELLRQVAKTLGFELRRKSGPTQVVVLQWDHGHSCAMLDIAKQVREFGDLKVELVEQEWRDPDTHERLSPSERLKRGLAKAEETDARYVVYVQNERYRDPKWDDNTKIVVRDLKTGQEVEMGYLGVPGYLRKMMKRVKHPFTV